MSAEALLREVEDRFSKQLAELESEYAKRMNDVRRAADEEEARIKAEAEKQAKALSEKERTRILGSARLQSKRIVADANQMFVQRGLEHAVDALKKYSASQDYKALIARMYEYAKKRLGEHLVVRCRPQDKQVFQKLGASVSDDTLDCIGGAVFSSPDGTLELDLRFEELIRLRAEELRAAIMATLTK